MTKLVFPHDFLWGVATSAQQVEGAPAADGRGPSIWDRFADEPGRIADGSRPDTACDHFRRWREDVALMAGLGLSAYRFSIAWPRVFPEGRGRVNPAGLDFYDCLVDGLLEAGIEPFPTLYHWDLPQALQETGGWANRQTVDHFADYTSAVVERLGDRVRHWTTLNEPWCIATLGHEEGHHAPGHRDPAEALAVAHHLLLAHGRAVARIREAAPQAAIGIVVIHVPVHPAGDGPGDRHAARWLDGFFNRLYLDPLFRGQYPEDVLEDRVELGHIDEPRMPGVMDGDLVEIAAPLDFVGVNYYSRVVAGAGEEGRPQAVAVAPPDELTDMGWEVYPDGLEESLCRLHRDYGPPRIYVTENGAAYDVAPDDRGRISDVARITYLREHLRAAHRSLERGVPLGGYFVWTLFDNFEWAHGFEKRFGLYAIEEETGRRIAKDSAFWYRQTVAANGFEGTGRTQTGEESLAS